MDTAADAEARRYHRRQFTLTLVDLAVGAALLVGWCASGAAARLVSVLDARLGLPAPAVVAVVTLAVGGAQALATFPIDVLAGFALPRRAGLSTQRFGAWLADRGKAFAIGGALGLVAVQVVYALLHRSPTWWWLWAGAVLAGGAVLLTAVVPIWLVPLFYRLTPLQDPALRARLLALAERMEVRAAAVAVVDFSRKGRVANRSWRSRPGRRSARLSWPSRSIAATNASGARVTSRARRSASRSSRRDHAAAIGEARNASPASTRRRSGRPAGSAGPERPSAAVPARRARSAIPSVTTIRTAWRTRLLATWRPA